MDKGETTGHMPSAHGICQRILAPGNGFLRMLRSVEFPCVDGYRAAGGWSINSAGTFCLVACVWVLTTADREVCFPRGRHLDGEYKITKPDTDNLQKLLKDCMTSVKFWSDDAQVASEVVEKFWADIPGIYIRVTEL